MVAKWPKYDTNDSKNMNYFCIPGRLQLRYYNHLKKLGMNPHKDLQHIIEIRLAELGVNVKLEELYSLKENIELQIKELEESNNLLAVNKYLQKDVQDRVKSFQVDLQMNKLPTELNIYFVSKRIAEKYEVTYNETIDLLKEKVVKQFSNNDLKNRLLDRIEIVRMNGVNGTLSDEQAAEVFKKACGGVNNA